MPLYDFECPQGHRFERLCSIAERETPVPCEGVGEDPCPLEAKQIIGPHNNPGGMLDHGSASNRDAAREGRYDPTRPNRKFMSKGRGWRR